MTKLCCCGVFAKLIAFGGGIDSGPLMFHTTDAGSEFIKQSVLVKKLLVVEPLSGTPLTWLGMLLCWLFCWG